MVHCHYRSRGAKEKKKFKSLDSATNTGKGLGYITHKKMIAYRCPICDHFHLTWATKFKKLNLPG